MQVTAQVIVQSDPLTVFAFLSNLRNHWQLTGRWVTVLELTGPDHDPTGGWVELRGPLRIRRRLRTTVVRASQPHQIEGLADLAPRTRARVTWSLEPAGEQQTTVTLSATVLRCGRIDGLLLALGGCRWLERQFRATLAQLSLALAGEHGADRAELVEQAVGARVVEDPFAV